MHSNSLSLTVLWENFQSNVWRHTTSIVKNTFLSVETNVTLNIFSWNLHRKRVGILCEGYECIQELFVQIWKHSMEKCLRTCATCMGVREKVRTRLAILNLFTTIYLSNKRRELYSAELFLHAHKEYKKAYIYKYHLRYESNKTILESLIPVWCALSSSKVYISVMWLSSGVVQIFVTRRLLFKWSAHRK